MWHASRLSQVDALIIDDRFHLRSDKITSFRLSGPACCLATRYRQENGILDRTNRAIYCSDNEIAAQFEYKLQDKKILGIKFDKFCDAEIDTLHML